MRSFFNLLHRWLGLTVAVFLVVAGLTGSVLAFYDELDVWTNPSLYRVSPHHEFAQPLSSLLLREQVLEQIPGIAVASINLQPTPNQAMIVYVSSNTEDGTIENDEVFIDPYTGKILGVRMWADITQGWKNFIPFLYTFHYSLALGNVGEYLFGIAALLWTVDCFVGFYLTFPVRVSRKKKAWLQRWKPAWLIRWRAGSYKLNFDLHRAGGLWVWVMLLVFAWSGVSLNLRDEIYSPVMSTVFDMETRVDSSISALPQPLLNPPINYYEAVIIGKKLVYQQALLQDFKAGEASSIYYDVVTGTYSYRFSSNADIQDGSSSQLIFSAEDGRYLGILLPNREPMGWQITTWIENLHRARIGGLTITIFVSVMGLVVTMLSITGVIIWRRKRKSRVSKKRKNQSKILKSLRIDSLRP